MINFLPIIGICDPVTGNRVLKNSKNIVHTRKLTDPKISRLRAAGNVQNVANVKHDITENDV